MNRRASAFLFLALSSAAMSPVWASEGGAQSPETTPLGWTMRGINFLVLVLGLGYLLRGAPGFFKNRAERIVGAITDARLVKEEADRQLRNAETKLARLEHEVADLRTAAMQDGAAEADRIRALAREEEAKIQKAAQMEIEAAERTARMELKALAAGLAIDRAEALVKDRMTPDAQSALVRAFVNHLEKAS